MDVTAILYLDTLSRSVFFRPYLVRLDSKPILQWLADRVITHSGANRLIILYHYESERALIEEAAGRTGAEIKYTPHFSELHAAASAAADAGASRIALLNLGCAIAPADLLLRVAEHHTRHNNIFTPVEGLPKECSLSIFDSATLAAISKRGATLGLFDPEYAAHGLLALQGQVIKELPVQLRATSFDFCASYSVTPASIPLTLSLTVATDCQLAEEAVVKAREDGLGLESAGLLCALKQVEIRKMSRECHLPADCLIKSVRRRSERRRVLYVSLPSAFSGAEQSLCSMIKFLDQQRFELFALTSRRGVFADKLRSLGVHVVCPEKVVPAPSLGNFCYALTLFQELGPDIIHLNGRGTLPFLSAAAACGIPVVQHVRNGDMSGFGDGLILAKSIISISEFLKREALRYPISEDKIRVIYDEVDSEYYRPGLFSKDLCRREFGLAEGARIALMIARVAPNKRHDLMVKAAACVKRQVPDFQLVIKGDVYSDSLEHHQIKSLIQKLDLETAVKWIDFVPDIRRLMAAADVLVLCSDREGLGSCVVEAMSMGLPVVVTDTGGTHEIVKSGMAGGFVVPGGDPEQLSARIVELLRDEDLGRRLGDSGREFVRGNLDARISARSVMEIYTTLLNSAEREGSLTAET